MTIVQIKALAEADSDGQRGTASRCSDRESRVESGDLEILKEERRDERICKIESRRIGTQESNGRETDPTATADGNGQARQPPRAVDLTQRADDPTECSQGILDDMSAADSDLSSHSSSLCPVLFNPLAKQHHAPLKGQNMRHIFHDLWTRASTLAYYRAKMLKLTLRNYELLI